LQNRFTCSIAALAGNAVSLRSQENQISNYQISNILEKFTSNFVARFFGDSGIDPVKYEHPSSAQNIRIVVNHQITVLFHKLMLFNGVGLKVCLDKIFKITKCEGARC